MSRASTHRSTERRLSATGDSLYIILGVEKTSTLDEIRRSYRKLALKYHPDKNLNNPEASEKFKDINRAHSILSDENKRKLYDNYGSMGLYLAEQLGEENLPAYYLITSGWCKGLLLGCCILTCGYFCCCCFCCCCNFCFGKCKPQVPDEEYDVTINPEEIEEELNTEQQQATKPPGPWDNGTQQSGQTITSQPTAPDPWGEGRPTVIAMPPPSQSSVNEATNLTTTYHSTYQ